MLRASPQINISSSSGAANSFALCHTSNGATSDQFVIDCGNAPSADYMEMYPPPLILRKEIIVPSSTSFVLDTHNNKSPSIRSSVRTSRVSSVSPPLPPRQGILTPSDITSNQQMTTHNKQSPSPSPAAFSSKSPPTTAPSASATASPHRISPASA